MIPAMPALAYPNTVRFTLTAFPYPVSPAYGKCRDNNKMSRTINGTEYKINHLLTQSQKEKYKAMQEDAKNQKKIK